MSAIQIGYARCSTDRQDLTAQRQALLDLGVGKDRIYTDQGLTGTNRARPGLDRAIGAVREGDTFILSKLDRLARSVPDARAKGKLCGKQPKLSERQQRELCRMHATGDYSISDLAEVFSISRPTVDRTISRACDRGV